LLSQTISHYRILNHLGTSLLGEVYLAEDTRLGRKVALLLLPEQFSRNVERMRRLAQEARILSSLNHPNIRMIYEVGQDESRHFIAAEFVEGPTLRAYLSYTRMKLDEVIDVTLQLLAGLAAAHTAGVIHRDLKPENIVLRPDGYVKILDFGLAKLVEQDSMMVDLIETKQVTEDLTVEPLDTEKPEVSADEIARDPYQTKPLEIGGAGGQGNRGPSQFITESGLWWMSGTTGYLSPEQVRGEPLDQRSDIFSLGVVVYEMCTGRLPFEGLTTTGVLNAILKGAPPPLSRFMPGVPEELAWIVDKALTKDREGRYQTAREWLNDLKRLKQRLEFEAGQVQRGGYPAPDSSGGRQGIRPNVHATSPIFRRESGGDSGRRGRRGTGSLGSRSDSSRDLHDSIDSIAVLPLANASNDPSAEYLSDGITESIINTLSRLTDLRVMARSTVFRYKGREIDPQEVGRELNVRAVFVGRLLQRGENIVIKAELVDTIDGALLWAEQYQRKSGDIFELEADIARQISDHLRIKISGEQQQNLAKQYTHNPQAYDLYLKGRFFWNQRNPEAIKKGIEYFVQSIKKDPGNALAYSGLADCYTILSWFAVPPREFVPKARMSVTRALEIDEQLPEAHTSLGFITLWYDWDFFKAEREFLRAIELNPNYPTAHHWYSYCLLVLERFDDAQDRIQRALNLDPLSLAIITDIGEQHYRRRRYEEALTQFQKVLEMDQDFAMAKYWMMRTWLEIGKSDQTIAALKDIPLKEGNYGYTALLGIAYAKAGMVQEAQNVFNELLEASSSHYMPPYYLAMIAANQGDKNEAFTWLDKAYKERSGWIPCLKQDPLSESLRTDARFSDLLRRVGLKP
jgi:serine/threonine protein kinase/Flp pilus assembly protein TadD